MINYTYTRVGLLLAGYSGNRSRPPGPCQTKEAFSSGLQDTRPNLGWNDYQQTGLRPRWLMALAADRDHQTTFHVRNLRLRLHRSDYHHDDVQASCGRPAPVFRLHSANCSESVALRRIVFQHQATPSTKSKNEVNLTNALHYPAHNLHHNAE